MELWNEVLFIRWYYEINGHVKYILILILKD